LNKERGCTRNEQLQLSLNKSSTFSGALPKFQENTKHDPETTKHVSSRQLLGPQGQGPGQPTKGTSERGKRYVFIQSENYH